MASAHALTDHDAIRKWAESRGAKPACVKGTGQSADDVGMIRLDFPDYTGEETLEPISWDEWFEQFDESNLALIVQDQIANGDEGHFNKFVGRESVTDTGEGSLSGRRSRASKHQIH